jgi:hypothetical protein
MSTTCVLATTRGFGAFEDAQRLQNPSGAGGSEETSRGDNLVILMVI